MSDDNFALGYAMGQDGGGGRSNDSGFFGNEGLWAVIILAIIFGWGNGGGFGGFGGGGSNGAVTRADICDGFNFNNLDSAVRGVQQGLCDGFYAMNTSLMNGFHGVDNALCSGFNNVNNNITQARFENQSCCCETQRLIERGFCDVINAGNQNTQRIIDHLTTNEMQSLRDQLQTANFQLSQQAQSANLINTLRPTPSPAYITCSPYESAMMYAGYGFNRGGNCGCGCG